jgi:hypothetical protein
VGAVNGHGLVVQLRLVLLPILAIMQYNLQYCK